MRREGRHSYFGSQRREFEGRCASSTFALGNKNNNQQSTDYIHVIRGRRREPAGATALVFELLMFYAVDRYVCVRWAVSPLLAV